MIFGRRRTNFFLAGLALATGLTWPTPSAAALPAISPPGLFVGYASFVCWDYAQLPRLRAWKETENIIATTLTEAYPALQKLPRRENGTPGQLKDFLRALPDTADRLTLVYLAAHQSPAGQWFFPDRSEANWGSLMEDLPKLKNTRRLLLLDSCYAASAGLWPGWTEKVAPACLFASPAHRVTPDLLVFWRRPVDWAVYFPGASAWLKKHHFTDSDERISFFGLVWLEAWSRMPSPPRQWDEWNRLAQTMTQIARRTSTQINSNAISEISAVFPP